MAKLVSRILLMIVPALAFAGDADKPLKVFPLTATDIEGNKHTLFGGDQEGLSVVVFISTDCPIANSYQPTLKRLAQEFEGRRVAFYLVHPSAKVTREQAQKHVQDFDIDIPVVLDRRQTITRRLDATVTPEAFLISPKGQILYHGRIDDLYTGYGKKRREPTSRDLHDAITTALTGKTPQPAQTKAIGCYISLVP